MHVDIVKTKEDEYLHSKGVKSSYALLCSSPQLVSAFVKETTHVTRQFNGISQFGKIHMYREYFPDMEARPKYTGFENVMQQDKALRALLVGPGKDEPANVPFLEVDHSFEEYLEWVLLSLENPLVYYSGGLDSEFVLRWFLKFGIDVECAVITWLYDGKPVNFHDVEWAEKFLKTHNLKTKRFKIELTNLWKDAKNVSKQIQRSSPQHIAYVKSIEILSGRYKYYHHVMAGEIRYALTKE